MAYDISPVMLAALQLDPKNARLGEPEPSSQQEVYARLAQQQGRRLITLAKHILDNGLDPTALPVVVPTGDRKRRYTVLEGNRRVLALKALETPALVSSALGAAEQKTLLGLSVQFLQDPLDEVPCVIFDTEAEALNWIHLRHTGANEGAGLVEWDHNEIDRWQARHGLTAKRNPAGQALDFYERASGRKVARGISTNVGRIVKNRECRRLLGLDLTKGELIALYPAAEIRKGLEKLITDLESKNIKVKDIYDSDDQKTYMAGFATAELPDPTKKLKTPQALDELKIGRGGEQSKPKPKPKPRPTPKPAQRTTVIPESYKASPTNPKLNTLYLELLTLDVNTYPNAAAVLLRVFVEQSMDHYLDQNPGLKPKGGKPLTLADKLKLVAADLEQKAHIPTGLRKVIDTIAMSGGKVMSASTNAFNQYVHNYFAFAKPQEIFTSWDELEPFMEKL